MLVNGIPSLGAGFLAKGPTLATVISNPVDRTTILEPPDSLNLIGKITHRSAASHAASSAHPLALLRRIVRLANRVILINAAFRGLGTFRKISLSMVLIQRISLSVLRRLVIFLGRFLPG